MDFTGKTITIEKPGYLGIETVRHSYNLKGQLIKTESEGIADFLYEYDQLGAVVKSGLDIDGNGILTGDSMDKITLADTSVVQGATDLWEVTVKKTLPRDNDPYEKTVSTQKTRLTGLGPGGLVTETHSIDIFGNTTIQESYVNRTTHESTAVTDFPDATNDAVALSQFGLLVSSSDKAGVTTLFDYDALGRKVSVTDPRTGTSTVHYNTTNQVDYTDDAAANRTSYGYDPVTGRKVSETSNNQTVYSAYDTLGNITHTWGATYPVRYLFDPYGRRVEMRTYTKKDGWNQSTWPTDPGTPAVTKYHYHEASGLLENKEDDLGKSTAYTYYSGGKLHTRTWARTVDTNPVVTTYSYDLSTGLLINTDYSDTTPDISFTYNRLGLKKTITDAQGSRNFAYNDNLQNYEETLSGNLTATITRTFETAGMIGRSTEVAVDSGYTVSYGHDPTTGRFNTVTWQVGNATDSATYSFMTNSHLIKDLVYDSGTKSLYAFEPQRDIRNQVKNQFNTTLISQYDYTHDPLGRVESMTTPDDIFASFMPAGQGNTIDFSKSSDVAYTPNSINQYTEITRNGIPETLAYDDDGNLLDDGTLTYTWNAENRLIGVEPVALTGDSDKKLEFTYDYMGRRIEKKIFTTTMGEYSLSSTTKYLYDGWNLIAELDEDGTTQAAYVWGLDLSQSLQGAGGVGGLLARVDTTTDKTHLYLYDGNGNVERLVDSADGSPAAVYKYDPYGNLISQAGLYAEVNPFRFSTKYFDGESSLYYYGYRYYAPELGRWVNRDPIGERGGVNLYGFVGNSPVNWIDPWGLFTLGDALDSLRELGVSPTAGDWRYGRIYSNTQIFDEWLRLEKRDTEWLDELTPCPQKIDPCKNPDENLWNDPGPANPEHSGATYEMRSKRTVGGHTNQCELCSKVVFEGAMKK